MKYSQVQVCRVLRAGSGDVVWLINGRQVETFGHLADGRLLMALDAEASTLQADAVVGQPDAGQPLGVALEQQQRITLDPPLLSVEILRLVNDMAARALAADAITSPEALQVLDWARDAMQHLIEWVRRESLDHVDADVRRMVDRWRTAGPEVAPTGEAETADTTPQPRVADAADSVPQAVDPASDAAVHVSVPTVPGLVSGGLL